MYEPLKVFTYLGLTICGAGFLLVLRFLYYVLRFEGFKHTNSLIVAAVLAIGAGATEIQKNIITQMILGL